MTAFDPQARLQRLEQQLEAFERLHSDELRELQRRLEAYQRLHEDEVRLLRDEIADLRAALGTDAAPPSPADNPEVVQEAVEEAVEHSLQQTVSRRELFGRRRADDAQ
jgi:hypothetical protein